MFGITPFGLLHTLISCVSLGAGLYGLWRYGELSYRNRNGKLYVWGTVAACVTGFFIVRHGGFSQAHALGILTLGVLLAAWVADRGAADRGLRRCFAALAYTATVFFHFIPGFNETLVRLPPSKPIISGPEDPLLFVLVGVVLAIFLVIGLIQAKRLLRTRDLEAAKPTPV
ncbi:hypothetical protein [Luteimonas saliphila]|uniref:hypothetical protein n=1 Tax=Luteimonas saliphila TaxID=2804919 RepID=UPI00192D214F|nr:hypothetical protein [Luteimonas saliphila]